MHKRERSLDDKDGDKTAETRGYTRLDRIIFSKDYGSVQLREFESIDCGKAPILEGFPSFGLTSVIVAGYIREQLNLPLIGVIYSDELPPACVVSSGHASYPVRLFGDRRIVIAVSEIKIPERVQYSLVRALIDFAKRHRGREIFTIDGIPDDDDSCCNATAEAPGRGAIHYLTTSPNIGPKLETMENCEAIQEGIIPGVTGALLAESSMGQVDVTCLLGRVSSRFPDARAAVRIVEILNDLMSEDFQLDLEPLIQKATDLENKIQKVLKDAAAGGNKDFAAPPGMYG